MKLQMSAALMRRELHMKLQMSAALLSKPLLIRRK